ncbi:hypothetical protein F5144DRAFT_237716 [Chaetomium tenue]|uniref:Uncharacterized protein n=1 Tax=Chaetomium tenue TaxID=1854479 RepID=A0ACB7PCS6_9PEZI|nr:hypothetical protein F5144DRAFT_237716 [Chaetomium globosum]
MAFMASTVFSFAAKRGLRRRIRDVVPRNESPAPPCPTLAAGRTGHALILRRTSSDLLRHHRMLFFQRARCQKFLHSNKYGRDTHGAPLPAAPMSQMPPQPPCSTLRNICVEVTRFCTKQGICAGERPHSEACEAMQPTPIRDACIMPVPASPSLVPSVPKHSSYQKRLRLDMMAFVAWSVGLQKSIFPFPMRCYVCYSPASLFGLQDLHVGFAALPARLHLR